MPSSNTNAKWWLFATTAISLAGIAAPALAADPAAPAAAPAAAPSAGVAEVVVSARRRAESVQKVPVAVSIVNGTQATQKNLNDIQDISAEVPAVDFRTGASNKDRTIFVRGLGTISTSPGVEMSVSTVVDGVVMDRPGMATPDIVDLDHIEVLRGPQGTLFGKNASAGVINIITKSPSSTPTGWIDGSYYEGNEYRLAGGVSGPITDTLKGRLALFGAQYDGNVKNLYDGDTVNGYQHEGGRAKLVYTPTSNLTLSLNGDYTHSVDTTPTGVWASTSQVAYPTNVVTPSAPLAAALAAQGIVAGPDNRTISDDINSHVVDDNGGVSLQADWGFGDGYKLTSITAWRDWRNVQTQDYDQTSGLSASIPHIEDLGHVAFTQTSEELRVASPKGQFVDYVVGFYYLDAVDHESYARDVTRILSGVQTFDHGLNDYGTRDANYAVFGEANLNFTSNFRAIAGFREVWDDLSYYTDRVSTATAAHSVTGVQPSFADSGSETKDGWAGRVGLQYDISPDSMAYATVSRGYKGPAYNVFFNEALANTPPLNPETSEDYEIGFKSQLLDHRLQIDLAGFIENFQNYQANSTQVVSGALVTNLVNAGSVTSQGVEGDIVAKPIEPLTLTANFAYDDAHVVDFPCPPGSAISCNINGKPLPFAPKWKFHLEGDYLYPLTNDIDLDLDTDYNWQSAIQYQLSETPDTIQPQYGIWNASIGLVGTTQGWSARLLVKNITNQHYSSYLSHGDVFGVVRWVPRDDDRYFGVNLRKEF
jgi:iron complex outermembrane receptor protein